MQRDVDELLAIGAIVGQVQPVPFLQLAAEMYNGQWSVARSEDPWGGLVSLEDPHRDESASEEVTPACFDESLDADLWRSERDDGVCKYDVRLVSTVEREYCAESETGAGLLPLGVPGWNPSPGLPCSTSQPLGMSTERIGFEVFLNSFSTVMKGARAGGLNEKPAHARPNACSVARAEPSLNPVTKTNTNQRCSRG